MADRRVLERVRIRAGEKLAAERRYKEAVIAAHVAGFTYREIAETAGVSHETVRSIVTKGTE